MKDAKRHLQKVNLHDLTKDFEGDWRNFIVTEINDHVIRASVLNRDFHWHSHEDSDETFLVLEGTLELDHEGGTETLTAGELFTVPKGIKHRTRAQGRVLNLTFGQRETDVTGGKGP